MALVNYRNLGGGGSSSGTKKKSAIGTSYSDNLLGNGVSNPQVSLPQNLSYKDNLVNLQPVGGVGAGTGGVTNEGVVLGNPSVERMPTINRNGSSAHQFKTFGQLVDETGKDLTSYAANGISEGTTVQESVLRRGTPEWDAVMNTENKSDMPYIVNQNSEETTGGGVKNTYAANGIGAEDTGEQEVRRAPQAQQGGSTTGSGEVDTYEEFLNKQEGLYKQKYEDLLAQIEAERQRGVIDARSSYEQNKATYGANAEQLAAMGLSGSGYSDYLNQQAYATQRAETQGANAQAESNRLQAELSYTENMMNLEKDKIELEEQKKAYYASLLASANTGKYTSEQIASLGAQYGLDEEQISQLQAAVESYEQQKYADNYATILDQMLSELPYYNDDNKLVVKEQDRNKMLEFLEENKDSLGEQLYDFYKKQIDNIEVYSEQAQKDDETAKQEEQQKEEDKQIITGNDSIEYNGKYYRLDSQLDKGANQIVRNNSFKDKLKELGYSDPFDKNIPNGTTIKSNVDNKGANDFNWWDDVGAFLLSPLGAGAWDSWANSNEITMTYYNGNWYLSSEV